MITPETNPQHESNPKIRDNADENKETGGDTASRGISSEEPQPPTFDESWDRQEQFRAD